MMQFVQGLPKGVYVTQTQIDDPDAQITDQAALAGFNLALHVGDDAMRVQQHRMHLLERLSQYGVKQCTWMNQTHSTQAYFVQQQTHFHPLNGDGLVTDQIGHALMMMTADCLPVVLGNAQGTEVANLHAGWKGLAGGIIENTIATMHSAPTWAWLGAAISQPCFEVGVEVKDAFCQKYPELAHAFVAGHTETKCYGDLYAIARLILAKYGIEQVFGGDQCTYQQAQAYYSYRRAPQTGRMATVVFIGQ